MPIELEIANVVFYSVGLHQETSSAQDQERRGRQPEANQGQRNRG